jgi:sulfur carrier protein ThiS
VRFHLLTPQGMFQEGVTIEVGKGLKLHKLLARLDKMGKPEKGFFRAVRKGRQGVTLLLNGDRLDIADARKTVIREGDEIAVLSQISGG